MTGSYLGKRSAELRADHQAACDQAELVTRCLYCPWTYTGTALEGRQLAEGHRRVHHPEAKAIRRRRRNIRRFHDADDSWRPERLANAEAVAAMHRRRAGRAA